MEEHSVLQRKVSTSSGMSKGKMLLLLNRLQSAFFKACYESCGVQLKSRASTMSFGCLSDLREELEGFWAAWKSGSTRLDARFYGSDLFGPVKFD